MKYLFLFLVIFLVALFQTTFFGFNFLLLAVLVFSLTLPEESSLGLAFLAGIFADLFSGGQLGYSSLGFVLIAFLVNLYQRRFSFQNPLVCFLFAFFASFLFSAVSQKSVNFGEGFWLGGFFALFRLLIPLKLKI